MSHSVIIILGACDAIKGNATTGAIAAARAEAVRLDTGLTEERLENPEDAHEALENFQTWLTTAGSYAGAKDAAEDHYTILKEIT